jgi:hypothetical protein
MRQFTTPDQTAKLIELGFAPNARIKEVQVVHSEIIVEHDCHFAIGELIEMLPPIIDEYSSVVVMGGGRWAVHYKRIFESRYDTFAKELIDALYEMILKLKKEGVI